MKKFAYYNDIDPFSCAWTRELIKAGLIPDGEVDERSIWDVVPNDLRPFQQAHFCNGISTWAYALRQANFPTDRVVWSGSMPCQSFSAAGVGKGMADNRGQLWYAFFWLIRVCRPDVVIGEQVEAAIKHDWLDHVALSLESIGYAVGAVGFPSGCATGGPHIRQRLYWVADFGCKRLVREPVCLREESQNMVEVTRRSPTRRVADAEHDGRHRPGRVETEPDCDKPEKRIPGGDCAAGLMAHSEGPGQLRAPEHEDDGEDRGRGGRHDASDDVQDPGVLGDSDGSGRQGKCGRGQERTPQPGPTNGFWDDCEWIPCRDGKARPTGRGISPLVVADTRGRTSQRNTGSVSGAKAQGSSEWEQDGNLCVGHSDGGAINGKQGTVESSLIEMAPGTPAGMVHSGHPRTPEKEIYPQNTAEARVGRLRGYGNSLCAPAAIEFIRAVMADGA